jgi:hypothetical protein
MPKFGDAVDKSKIVKGVTPILFQVQPEGYIKVTDDVRGWEHRLKELYGIDAKSLGKVVPLDTCSGGTLDDCGAAAE